MKKGCFCVIFTLIFALFPTIFASFPIFAEGCEVTVTVAVEGQLVLAAQPTEVTDSDGDGALTINDALLCAHEKAGKKGGYGWAEGDYGLYITSLWGDGSGAFGYMRNDAPALSLSDPVEAGDRVCAYVYADRSGYSDLYTFFSISSASAKVGEEVTLTLFSSGYDENWAPVTFPVEGAELLFDGEPTGKITEKDGKVTFTAEKAGQILVSAKAEGTIVPPYAVLTVEKAPDTGDHVLFVLLLSLAFRAAVVCKKR